MALASDSAHTLNITIQQQEKTSLASQPSRYDLYFCPHSYSLYLYNVFLCLEEQSVACQYNSAFATAFEAF